MTSTTREPSYVPRRRALKAARLAASLAARGVTVTEAARYDHSQRRSAERIAVIRKASGKTWRQVLDMLAGSAQPHALCPFCGHGDPEGIEGPPQPFLHQGPCSK